MIRQSAFQGNSMLLKGALHCHTTRSDGVGSPEKVIRLHKQHGYDFMALTDHSIYNYQNFAPDVDITILPGMERNHNIGEHGVHTFHSVCLGPPQGEGNGYAQDEQFDPYVKVKDQFDYQPILDDIHAHGNQTIYCHPEWSNTPAREFDQMQGHFAMEIWNSGCVLEDDMDSNAAYWDELLMQDKRLWGVATDDGHGMNQHCIGWVMVQAENDVSSILKALREGSFYSTCGPEIHDFYVGDDGVAVLECSPCAYAGFRYGLMPNRLTHSQDGTLTRATYPVPEYFAYIRGIVKDAQGRKAWTNPIFLKNSQTGGTK